MQTLSGFGSIEIDRAAERIRGVVYPTPLTPFPAGSPRIELRLKLECLQETGSFKARGAWNQVSQLDDSQRRAGVVTTSSGNHGKALAWAAERAGVPATIFMPSDAYPNKVAACRDHGAEVVLCASRDEAERACASRVASGAVLVHPYDAERTVEGAGTVGLEIAREWPEVDVVAIQVGGGGLLAGSALALRRELGARVKIVGVEPAGAPTMTRGLAAGKPGALNIAIAKACVDRVETIDDEPIFAAQAELVNEGAFTVEPAGAAALAWVLSGAIPELWFAALDRKLRVCAVVSGGNPAPEQLERLRAEYPSRSRAGRARGAASGDPRRDPRQDPRQDSVGDPCQDPIADPRRVARADERAPA